MSVWMVRPPLYLLADQQAEAAVCIVESTFYVCLLCVCLQCLLCTQRKPLCFRPLETTTRCMYGHVREFAQSGYSMRKEFPSGFSLQAFLVTMDS